MSDFVTMECPVLPALLIKLRCIPKGAVLVTFLDSYSLIMVYFSSL